MLLTRILWAGRVWALPFLTALAPSERCRQQAGRRHKSLTNWGCQILLLVGRWLPGHRVIAVADTTYAASNCWRRGPSAHRGQCLRLDARLFDLPPPRRPGAKGRPRVSGERQPSLVQRLADPASRWCRVVIGDW
jgi:hypothetical protein